MGLNKGTILSITTQTKAANRFESIDSFRGIAALSLKWKFREATRPIIPIFFLILDEKLLRC